MIAIWLLPECSSDKFPRKYKDKDTAFCWGFSSWQRKTVSPSGWASWPWMVTRTRFHSCRDLPGSWKRVLPMQHGVPIPTKKRGEKSVLQDYRSSFEIILQYIVGSGEKKNPGRFRNCALPFFSYRSSFQFGRVCFSSKKKTGMISIITQFWKWR